MRNQVSELEHLVLLSVLRLESDAYGVAIQHELDATAHRNTSRAAVYVALRRLEQQGLLSSSLSAPTAERGGRAKRFYALTEDGYQTLRTQRATLTRMWAGWEKELGT